MREQGYAVAVDELEIGLTAIAAPIRNAHGDVIASLSVSGPTFRLGEARVKELVPVVQDAADEVSRRLGYRNRPRSLDESCRRAAILFRNAHRVATCATNPD